MSHYIRNSPLFSISNFRKLFILTLSLLFLFGCMGSLIPLSKAETIVSRFEYFECDAIYDVGTDWTPTGESPYIRYYDDGLSDKIEALGANKVSQVFTFENLSWTGVISVDNVTVVTRIRSSTQLSSAITGYTWNGAAYANSITWTSIATSFTNLSDVITPTTEMLSLGVTAVNEFRLYYNTSGNGATRTIYIDAACLKVGLTTNEYYEGVETEETTTEADNNEVFDNLMAFVLPVGVLILPAVLLCLVTRTFNKWVIILGVSIGAALGFYYALIPIWVVFLVVIGLVGMSYDAVRNG